MTGLRLRSARFAWLWCLAYTVAVGPELRDRRRGEVRSHLWESQAAGVRSHRLLSAVLRGAADDLSWSLRRGWRYSLALPELWVGVGALFPVGAWLGALVDPAAEHRVDLAALLAGPLCLAISAVVWLRRRRG